MSTVEERVLPPRKHKPEKHWYFFEVMVWILSGRTRIQLGHPSFFNYSWPVVINISSSSCILREGNSAVGFWGFRGLVGFFSFGLILFVLYYLHKFLGFLSQMESASLYLRAGQLSLTGRQNFPWCLLFVDLEDFLFSTLTFVYPIVSVCPFRCLLNRL